ncbi:M20/M25/M40 family metallo-hydrolase, partial [Georgenia sp. 10Sc9-8]|nr:M20/M25/M40 family metallo-hydrolase [Georgenia halotolerans]
MTAAQEDTTAEVARIEAEAVRITQELIRIDSTNHGDGSGPGERAAADYVCDLLREVGLEPTYLESEPGRASVVVRLPGADPTRPGLVLHGHLDVVPATAADWSVDPFSGEIRDGMIWGRGAVDMKDMVAMMLANVRHLARTGTRPPRDLVVAFFADEEAGGTLGAQWLVTHHPELFAGCSEAVSEVGGYSITLPARDTGDPVRAYLLQTAEKGFAWVRLRATGRAGHGSIPSQENAIVRLARAIDRIDAHVWPREFVAAVDTLFDGVSRLTGVPRDEEHFEEFLPLLGGARQFVVGTLQDSATPTML